MASERYKPKVKEIKASLAIAVEKGKTHQVVLIGRGTYLDAICHTCKRAALCGGDDAEKMLRGWAAWHAAKVEVHEEKGDGDDQRL
jgi:hypothetical protein